MLTPPGPQARYASPYDRQLRFARFGLRLAARLLEGVVWPKIEWVIRWWLAGIFFASGLLKLMHWQTALYLATFEYPVHGVPPVLAAYLGVCIELLGAILLALGFMTRYAAFCMLLLTLVAQLNYQAVDSQMFWIALFAWFVIRGAGHVSVDQLLRGGLAASALPVIPRLIRVSGRVRDRGVPLYLSALRIWLGLSLVTAAFVTTAGAAPAVLARTWLPLSLAMRVPALWAWLGGVPLIAGIGTRAAAAALMLALFAETMMDPRTTDAAYLLMVLSLLVVHGGGALSIDRLILGGFARFYRALDARDPRALAGLPRVVIVGTGFGGLSCARALSRTRAAVTLIDRTNFHLFQPLLYQVATAALSPSDIATPVRQLFRHAFATRVLLGTVTGVDTAKQAVLLDGREIPYDYLVMATGAAHSYFGQDQWAAYAPGLKGIEDAIEIRRRILTAFERAEATEDADERAALLTFLIVGGGPTGVELAGAIAELARFGMEKDFRAFDPAQARVILVQSARRLLPSFPERLALIAQRSLERLGVEVRLGVRVEAIDATGVQVDGQPVAARTVLWAAGVAASPAARWLGAAADSAGRVKVDTELRVPGFSNVFAIGDTAASAGWAGKPVPGVAPAAKQGGTYVARQIHAAIHGGRTPEAFRYRHYGSLATIGRKAAVADFQTLSVWGAPAWWLWGVLHIGFLLGLRNRVATLSNWFWAYLRFGGGIRLITRA